VTHVPMDLRLAPDHALTRVRRTALVVGVAGLAVSAVGAFLSPPQFLRSYLVAYLFWLGVPLGSLAILMINHITGGAWGAIVRRILESGTRTLPLMAIAFVPIVVGLRALYPWAQPAALDDPLLAHKHVYLNVPFFLGRAVFYFAAWMVVAHFLNRWSLEQDATDDPAPAHRLEQLSRGGLLLLGLTMTFASIDWAMSLEPRWFSTIYGVIFMGGSVVTAFAVVIPVAAVLAADPPAREVMTPSRFHDLGKLLLAFVMLWAYFSYSQFLIIWSANLPEEVPWYVARLHGGWQWPALAIVVFHFALPFLVLLSRDVKRRARTLAVVALALVVARFLDVFWLVTPAFSPEHLSVHALDAAAVLGLGGVWVALFLRQLEDRPLVPLRDPSLAPEGA